MKLKKLAPILILQYENVLDTLDLLGSIISMKDPAKCKFDFFVIDNASSKKAVDELKKEAGAQGFEIESFYDVKQLGQSNCNNRLFIIEYNENFGYAGAYNRAVSSLKEEYDNFVLLNNDLTLDYNFFSALEARIFAQGSDIFSGLVLYHWDKALINSYGADYRYGRGYHLTHFQKPLNRLQLPDSRKCAGLHGCLMVFSRESFEKVGGFDDKYFLYLEESDFFIRAHRLGLSIVVYKDICVFHKEGASTNSLNSFKLLLICSNALYFADKNMPFIEAGLAKSVAYIKTFMLAVRLKNIGFIRDVVKRYNDLKR